MLDCYLHIHNDIYRHYFYIKQQTYLNNELVLTFISHNKYTGILSKGCS